MKVYYCEYFFVLVELLSDKEKLQKKITLLTLQMEESNQQIQEPHTQKTLEVSEEKGEFLTTHVVYCLVLSYI